MMDYRENLQKCHEYVRALEEERRKIEMFQRELPLCLEIVSQAIETCKQQLSGTTTATATATTTTTDCLNGQSECSEQTTSDGPVFEEFIPIKRSCSSARGGGEEEDEYELESHKNPTNFNDDNDKSGSGKKSDWLRSAQLWSQSPDPPTTTTTTKEEHQSNQPRKVSVVEVKTNGGAFHPFQKDKNYTTTTAAPALTPAPAASACSTAEMAAGGGCGTSKKDEAGKDGQPQPRKARRCWSSELHRRFLNALEQLGGSHAATPKQIRELMKVDGLTNDEVKSHLQKYRLHTRRPTPAGHNNTSSQAQFVVVSGIWVPPPEYATASAAGATTTTLGEPSTAATTAPTTGIYAPIAAPPAAAKPHQATTSLAQRQQQQHQHKQSSQSAGSHSEGGVARCNSPATSSSTRTVTASPAY